MKQTLSTQQLIILIFAVALLILFQKSRIDREQHENTIISFFSLIQINSLISQQTIKLQTGLHKNYDAISRSSINLQHLLNQLTQNLESAKSNNQPTIKLLHALKQQVSDKAQSIDIFKQQNAIFHNSLHYLPSLSNQYFNNILTSSNLSQNYQFKIKTSLDDLLFSVYLFQARIDTNPQKVQKLIALFKHEVNSAVGITPLQRKGANKIAKLSESIIIGRNVLNVTINSIINDNVDFNLQAAKNVYFQNFSNKALLASRHLVTLILLSFFVLLYLAYLFIRLEKTSRLLGHSLTDLQFNQYALDEHAIVSTTDKEGTITFANQHFVEVTGYQIEELMGKTHSLINAQHHSTEFFKTLWDTIIKGDIWKGEILSTAKNGKQFWVEATIVPRLDNKGVPYEYLAIRTEITAQKMAEQQAIILAKFPAEQPEPVMRINANGRLLYANNAAQRIIDSWQIKLNDYIPDYWITKATNALLNNEIYQISLDVQDFNYIIHITPIVDEHYINFYARDITQAKLAEEKLSYQATHDPLTNLTNRFAFELLLSASIKECEIDPKINTHLLYIDLDQFKIINDTCGHVAGDELLRQISTQLESQLRHSDTLARLGGDEFGIILNHCPLKKATLIANNICTTVKDFRFMWADKSFTIGASIGLVKISDDINTVSKALGAADVACYMAKDLGRNQVHIYQPDTSTVLEKHKEMLWATSIPKAIEENQFILYAQPIKALTKNDQSHYEVLIRYTNDLGEVIPPGAFIPSAERYDLITDLDMWVVNNTFNLLTQYPNFTDHVSINLSGLSLGSKDFLEQLIILIKASKIDPTRLTFEVTETAAISHLSAAIYFIEEIKKLGCQFALDDFGSGLSSFSYLKNLPVDYLKIDGAFVKDILVDPIDEAMVRSINEIGHVMGIKTIAEFVETKAIERKLKSMNIDYVQGYAIAKPRSFEDILKENS